MRIGIRIVVLGVLLVLTALPVSAGPNLGNSPRAAVPLGSGLNVGTLEPGDGFWYAFTSAELGDQPAQAVVLNMVYKPGGHDVAAYVNFKVFAADQVDLWLQGHADQYAGMGTFTTTDFDQETAERLWSGNLFEGETYYVHVFNNSDKIVEYHLTALGQLGEGTIVPGKTVSPASHTAPVNVSANSLKPGASLEETQWLLVASAVQGMSTTDAAAWLMMASQMGWLPAGGAAGSGLPSVYAVQPGNAVPERAALTEVVDTAREESVEAPAQAEAAPSLFDLYPNVYPTAPLALDDGVNVGKLAPGGEHWYSFIREDRDAEWYEYLALTLFSTPADGNRSHHINFQIFTGNQLQVWMRGTPEDMVPMGAGQWVSRDKDPVTGERLWAGHVVDGDRYYVRVFNNSDQVIDYYLITGDIINTELGDRVWAANPVYRRTLWQSSSYVRTYR